MKHMKYIFFCLFLMLIIYANASANDITKETFTPEYGTTINNENGILNPKWEYYNSLSDEEKAEWEAAPEKYVIPHDNEESTDYYVKKGGYSKIAFAAATPASYDLRQHSGVSPIENQGNLGICWAFAANASLESNLLVHSQSNISSPTIFSERHLDYASAKNSYAFSEGFNPYGGSRNLGEGGAFNSAASYYAMGIAPVGMTGVWSQWNESKSAVSIRDIFNLNNNNILVTDYVEFPYINVRKATANQKSDWRNKVKNHIMANGAVYISTLTPQKSAAKGCYVENTGNGMGLLNWNESCEKSFATSTYSGTHAMAIIGWDDKFNLSYCSYKDGTTSISNDSASCTNFGGKFNSVTGAWILKNSWGNQNQYIYLAYDSDFLEAAGITKAVTKDYDNSYNSYGPVFATTLTGYNVQYLFYKPRPTEKLKRVTFETDTTESVTYSVYYGDYSSNETYLIGTVTADMPGRYSVDASNVSLSQEDFVIYIKPSKGNILNKPSKVYAFTVDTQDSASATTYLDKSNPRWQTNNTYVYNIESRVENLNTGTQLTYVLKDVNGTVITSYTDGKALVVAGAVEGQIVVPYKLADNSIYYIETYANGSLIGKNSFATGMPLASTTISGATYYKIKTQADLKFLTTLEYKFSNFQLDNDITLNSSNFEPLGRYTVDQFRGTLNGNSHTISNLVENNSNTGLFYKIEANISNLKIKGANLTATGNASGVLASQSYRSTIRNVLTEGILTSTKSDAYLGGIIGYAEDTDFINVVNETSLANGKSGEITGYLGSYSTIKNALNQGLISGNKSAASTFFHGTALNNNSIENLVDLTVEINASCTTPISPSTSQLSQKNVIYNSADTCNYIGAEKSLAELKNPSTYSGFGSSWTTTSSGLPSIVENPVIYITSFTPTGAKNLFVGVNSVMEISTNPSNATYKGVSLSSDNSNVVKVVNGNQLQGVSQGQAQVTVTTLDGSNITQTATVYVLSNELKRRFDNGYLYIPEGSTTTSLGNSSGYTVSSSTSTIRTGTKLTYKYGDQVVGSFTGVIKGDLTEDGQIQADDILLMKRHILELDKSSPLNSAQLKAGNINGDGITSAGILVMRRHILGLDGGGEL